DLERHLSEAALRARTQGIAYLVLRLKRARNPDVVALEALDKFLSQARRDGLTILLAGVRTDLLGALRRVGIVDHHGAELIFPEGEEEYSGTLKAIRKAYTLLRNEQSHRGSLPPSPGDSAYYLV
ncbi:MAG: sodium-independent anion transporter, partial [Burkholderiaceae bacterium]